MNPQAFPSSHQNTMNGYPSEEMKGMDLRDYFAAKAIQAFIANTKGDVRLGVGCKSANELYATASYSIADAMMKARND